MNAVILGIFLKVTMLALSALGLLVLLARRIANRPRPVRQRVVIVPSHNELPARIESGRLTSSPSRAPPGLTGIQYPRDIRGHGD